MNEEYKEIEGIEANTYAGKAALAVKKKVRGIMGDELLIFHLIDFVTFIQLNNKFLDIGIHITESNKEECYIKIIEMEKPELIDDLEKYIDLRDNINKIAKQKEEYQSVIDKLKNLQDKEDGDSVNTIIEEYLRR
jgi:hypothetical protein